MDAVINMKWLWL